MSDKRDKAITCVLCRDLHFTLTFPGHLLKDLFKGVQTLVRFFSNKIVNVTLVTQGLPSFLSRPVV